MNIHTTESPIPLQTLRYYTGGGYLEYLCEALSVQPKPAVIVISGASNADPVSFTATSHGLDYPSAATVKPLVRISGATGGWAGINGVWAATVTGANAFTIPVNSTGFGSFSGQTIVVETFCPRTTDPVWRVKKFVYDGSNREIFSGYGVAAAGAGSSPLTGPNTQFTQIAANRASLAYQ